MKTGKIKWFSSDKGYGFIELENEKNDVFVHVSALENMEPHNLQEGTAVEFEIVELRGKNQAAKVRKVD